MKVNKTIEANFFFGAKPIIFEMARELRKNMTESETILWNEIKEGKIFNLHFRRQHPINRFIADFYCHKTRLVIELDGCIHLSKEQKERDQERDSIMKEFGLTVLRFTNNEVRNNIPAVINRIKEHCVLK